MRILKWVLLILLAIVLLVAAGFTVWAYTPLGPMPEAIAALQSDAQVQVDTSPWLTFTPAGTQPTTGFIFYPGGRVDTRSYAPAARAIAEQGYLVTIAPMPFNLAVFKPAAADAVIAAHPEIEHWVIGGHSLGGAMAANYVYTHPDVVQGLALWAGYPASNNGLGDRRDPRCLDLWHERRVGIPIYRGCHPCSAACRHPLRAHRGRQPRADGVVRPAAGRRHGDDQPRGPTAANGCGDRGTACDRGQVARSATV